MSYFPSKARRQAIVARSDGYTTRVGAAAIQSADELAYAIGFLAHHRLYKMSKTGGVTVEKAREVAGAMVIALEAFESSVIDRLEGKARPDQISGLGDKTVRNPFGFVGS